MNASIFLVLTGILAGSMNALAGGGSFVTLSALVASGVPSVLANATSSVALLGGLGGSLLLLSTPSVLFDRVLPWLLLLATLALMFGPRLGVLLRAHLTAGKPTILTIQFLLGIYGGYFGGAVGLMMMAAWGLLKSADIKALNAPRTLMVTAANTIAIVCFAVAGTVRWEAALLVGSGAVLGGYAGAHLGRRLKPTLVRNATLLLSVAITVRFFMRAYF
jgi:uncharacterized membrane protein YfcA